MLLFLKNLAFTVLVPGSVGIWIPLWIASGNGAAVTPPASPAQGVALAVVVVGFSIYLWCVWDFGTHGRGTPAPIDAPKVLVVRGLYRYVRNPMYVGVGLMITGWWLYFGVRAILVYGAWGIIPVQLFVLFYEEPHLKRLFGAQYERYCRRVRRWIPGKPFSEPPPAA